jgi:hypothetical protein
VTVGLRRVASNERSGVTVVEFGSGVNKILSIFISLSS